MTTTNWTGDAGTTDFNTAGNWDNGVPVAGVDAVITGTAVVPLTVTFSSGTTTAQTLTTTFTTLEMEGGTLQLTLASALDALTMSGGTLDFANGGAGSTASTFSGPVTMTAGTLEVDAGTLTLNGTNALAGLITGGGSVVTVGATAVDGLFVDNGTTLDNKGTETLTTGDLYLGESNTGTATLHNEAGATFDMLGDADITYDGGTTSIVNAGLFEKTGGTGTSDIATAFSTTGTIKVTTGTLEFTGSTDTFSGTISGAGTVDFAGTTQTWAAGLTLTVQNVTVSGTLNLSANITYGGAFDASGATLALGSHTLTLSAAATADLMYATITGTGKLVTQDTVAVDDLTVGNGATLDNQGTETLTTSNIYLGEGNTGTATLDNEAGATFDMLGDVGVTFGGGATSIVNAGLFEKTGGIGTSDIGTPFSNTGTVTVTTGTLEFDANNTYGGTFSGAGTVDFAGGTQTWAAGLTLTVQNVTVSGTLNLSANITYGGALDASGATLALGSHTLTLSAAATADLMYATITGTGKLVTQDTVAVDDLTVGNGATLDNQGTETLTTSNIYLGEGNTGTATLDNEAGATFDMLGDVGVTFGGGATSIVNAGLFEKTGGIGTSDIGTPFSNTGTVTVTTGTLEFDANNTYGGTFSGAGTVDFAGGTQTWAAGLTLTVQNVTVSGTLNLSANITYGGALDASGATLALGSQTLTLSAAATADLMYATITGTGKLVTQDTVAVDDLTVGNGATLDNQGTETLTTSNIYLGEGNTGTATLDNEAGATFDMLGDVGVTFGGGATSIVNAGLFEKTGGIGTSDIGTPFSNTGTVTVTTGTLEFDANNTYGGTFSGAGTVDFAGGTQTWAAGLTLTVQNVTVSGTLNLSANITYGGALDASGATLALGSHTLTLSAASTANFFGTTITGTGKLVTQDTVAVDDLTVGNGATLDNQGTETLTTSNIYLGEGNTGTATLDNEAGATFDMLGDVGVTFGGGATSIVNAGLFEKTGGIGTSDIGTPFSNTGTVTVSSGTLDFSGAVTNNGMFDITGADLTVQGGSFSNSGSITVTGGYAFIDTTTFTSTGSVTIGNGGTLEIQPATAANITYNDPANLILDDPSGYTGTLSGLMTGDTLQLDRENIASAGISGTTLTVNLTGGGSLTYKTGPGLNGTTFSVTEGTDGHNDLLTVLCFLPGTLIATPAGETPVEHLVVGDRVRTASGAVRPIAWIGQGRVLATPGRRTAATPVVVSKGALGPNIPHHDLRVTKGHSFLLDGVLIPAEFLVNHRSIHWDDRAQEVTLYHIELDEHDILLANGAPAESYRDDGNRWLFQNANSGWDQPAKPPCAPVLTGGPVVDAVWRRLLDRAGGPTRLPLTQDAQLALLVDGARLAPTVLREGMAVFILDSRPHEVRLVSRSAVPLELGLCRDARELGVAVRRLAARKGARPRVIESEDARLTEGFHAFEADSGIRWTNGDALLPAELFAGFKGEIELAIHLGGTTSYLAEGEERRAA